MLTTVGKEDGQSWWPIKKDILYKFFRWLTNTYLTHYIVEVIYIYFTHDIASRDLCSMTTCKEKTKLVVVDFGRMLGG